MEDVIFLPADKGNSTVVLNRSSYEEKIVSLINEGPYEEIKSDPGQRFRKKLAAILKPLVDRGDLECGIFLLWCPNHFVTPHIYGLPKIHKDGCPLRPIVSMRGSLFNPVGRYLPRVLAPYYKEAASHADNSSKVKNRIASALESFPQATMGSYDVVSLFTRVPVR